MYDTLEKGYLTSSTRYVGGASGAAYTQAITGYNTAYQPLASTLTVPSSDGFAAAGQSSAPTSGTVTYTATNHYTDTVGLLSTTHFQADGNLPAEDIDYGYTQQGNLDGIGGFINNANTPAYLDTTVHDAFGRVMQANYGHTGKELATFAQYDGTTGRVTQTSSMLQTSTTALDVTNLRYNQVGELTAIDDLQDNTTHDTQCFTYDSFQRLTAAWTDTLRHHRPERGHARLGRRLHHRTGADHHHVPRQDHHCRRPGPVLADLHLRPARRPHRHRQPRHHGQRPQRHHPGRHLPRRERHGARDPARPGGHGDPRQPVRYGDHRLHLHRPRLRQCERRRHHQPEGDQHRPAHQRLHHHRRRQAVRRRRGRLHHRRRPRCRSTPAAAPPARSGPSAPTAP